MRRIFYFLLAMLIVQNLIYLDLEYLSNSKYFELSLIGILVLSFLIGRGFARLANYFEKGK